MLGLRRAVAPWDADYGVNEGLLPPLSEWANQWRLVRVAPIAVCSLDDEAIAQPRSTPVVRALRFHLERRDNRRHTKADTSRQPARFVQLSPDLGHRYGSGGLESVSLPTCTATAACGPFSCGVPRAACGTCG